MAMTEQQPSSREISTTDQEPMDLLRIQTGELALARTALESDWGPGRTQLVQDFMAESAAARTAENQRRSAEGEDLLPEITYDSQGDAS